MGVLNEAGGLFLGNLREVLDEDAVVVEEAFHAEGIAEGQIALDDQAIEAGENSGDFISVFLYKGLHGVSLFFRGWWYNHSEKRKRRFHPLFGCGEAALGKWQLIQRRSM